MPDPCLPRWVLPTSLARSCPCSLMGDVAPAQAPLLLLGAGGPLQTKPYPSHHRAVFLLRRAELHAPSKPPGFLLALGPRRHTPCSAAKSEDWPWEHCSEPLLFPRLHRETRRNPQGVCWLQGTGFGGVLGSTLAPAQPGTPPQPSCRLPARTDLGLSTLTMLVS